MKTKKESYKESYEDMMLRSQAASWWSFAQRIVLTDVVNTIEIFKKKLKDDDAFEKDLIQLRKFYKEFRDSSKINKEQNQYNKIDNEKQLLRNIFDILNSYYDKTGITMSVEKRVTKARFFTPGFPSMIDSYYFRVGKNPGMKDFKF